MQTQEKTPLLSIRGMTKIFDNVVVALKNVDLTVYPGDVLGLIDENGSGKSTITSIAAGMQKATEVESMQYKGEDWKPSSMLDALSCCGKGKGGIGMIVQESGTVAGITVAENIFLGELDAFRIGHFGPVNRKKLYAAANAALDKIGVKNVRANMPMAALDFQSRKLVEIAKVLMKDPDLIVVDETSTALAHDGREILYNIVNSFRGTDKAVIFISHDLDEIMEVCDTLTVLRDGQIIRTFEKAEFEPDDIRRAMIGRDLQGDYYRSDFEPSWQDDVTLEAGDLWLGDRLRGVSLQLHKGEILGFGGLSHCGMHDLGRVLFGAVKPERGTVTVGGVPVKDEAVAMKEMIGYVSKDRDNESLALTASIKDNIAIGGMEKYAIGNFFVLNSREKKYVDRQIDALSIKCSSREQITGTLSGGNKQKVVFGKWVGRDSEILILDCPTRGVDIGVKQAMYQLMIRLKNEGKSIILISEELPELLGMSDRICIMKDGAITKEFLRSSELSDADVINYMI